MIKALLFFFISFQLQAGEVQIIAKLIPGGTIELESDKLLGQLIYNKTTYYARKLFIDVRTLKSGIELRDQHLHKYLINNGSPVIYFEDVKIDRKTLKGQGFLKINDVKKLIRFNVQKKKKYFFTTFNINKVDFKLPIASYMGITSVDPNLKLNIKIFPKDLSKEENL